MPGLLKSPPCSPPPMEDMRLWAEELRESVYDHDRLMGRFNHLRRELDHVSAQLSRSRHRMIQRSRLDPEDGESDTSLDEEFHPFNGRYYSPSLESSGEILVLGDDQDRLGRLYNSVSLESSVEIIITADEQERIDRLLQDDDDDEGHMYYPALSSPQQMPNQQHFPGPMSAEMDRHIDSPGYMESLGGPQGHASSISNPAAVNGHHGDGVTAQVESVELYFPPGL